MADDTYRRYHAGKYGETRPFTENEEINKEMTERQSDLEKRTEESPVIEKVKKLRDRTRKELEDMGL